MDSTTASEAIPIPVGRIETPAGLRVGNYKIIRIVGEGGFGIVYEAEQLAPVRRVVALKVLRPGRDSTEALARFQTEQQALASMEHPGIATLFDAGILELPGTAHRSPYFAMELVRGDPIDDFCDRRRLPILNRIELIRQACAAIDHAHRRGILHRDIKPSNILVTYVDGEATVKVIDFGIAKALIGAIAGDRAVTQDGQFIGTLHYASPEQLLGDHSRLDARSDVYSLGVVLYRLVAGVFPLAGDTAARFPETAYSRVQSMNSPPKPTTRLRELTEELPRLAYLRRTGPDELLRLLRDDLQDILLSALQREPEHRYNTTADLADDLGRFSGSRPLRPMPFRSRSPAYRIAKWSQRWRVLEQVKFAITTVCSLVSFVCFASIILLTADYVGSLRLFGEYGPNGLDFVGVLRMNIDAAVLCAVTLLAAHYYDRGRVLPVLIATAMLGLLAGWALGSFSGLIDFPAGGLLEDVYHRRTFTLIYMCFYVPLFLASLACIPIAAITSRYAPQPSRRAVVTHA
ncbi:MAG: serine/threonine-protein kinase [Planctomycetota bacterium]